MRTAAMTIILNPFAAGGRAMKKWNALLKATPAVTEGAALEILGGRASAEDIIREALRRGGRRFVAAGGDGTVNLVLEAIMNAGCENEAVLGAIGLGSSNDFHKPCTETLLKIDFARARPRDVGSFTSGAPERKRYFLVNASIGVTAEANDFFNRPDRLLAFQKHHATQAAIYYAALKTILTYRNRSVAISSSGGETFRTSLTNLGVVKSPHFSGNLSYGGSAFYDDGLLKIHLCENLNAGAIIRLLRALGTENGRRQLSGIRTWSTPDITVEADSPFAVEFDGEVVRTASARFAVIPRTLKVCP
jgi:diacylglycerol kinase (ATP)